MAANEIIQEILRRQVEIYEATQIGNVLALFGRAFELAMLVVMAKAWQTLRLIERRTDLVEKRTQ